MDEFQLTQDQVSQRVGKSRPQISNMLRLLSLPNEIKMWLNTGELSVGHARALLALETRQEQIELSNTTIKNSSRFVRWKK
ncbi:hypothetical protein N752_25905 [Desulforamulus aquiferis]|nr:hypothetical protein N752_25905 [Desulforamulus aquiferis]